MGSLQSTIMAGLSSLFSLFSTSIKDIGIDLGTANTLVYVRGEGIVLREPSVVAVDANSNEVLAIGKKAKEMLGRTPESITAVRPLKDGVIADFEVTAAMLKYFVRKAIKAGSFTRPHIVICIPSGVTEVERRAVEDAAKQAGASRVELILEPVAAAIGAGLPTAKIDQVVGVVKAYSSCVGEGPFVCEWFGEDAQKLRDAGAEYGAKTGRPRRVGPIDLVATRYGVRMQNATNIALTKLDILSYMDRIPVCAHYEIDGQQTDEFPFPVLLDQAKPVTEYVPGWNCDISGVRTWEELPQAARDYVEYVERAIGCRIGYVSVGAERDSLIVR